MENLYLLIKGRHDVPFTNKVILDRVEDPSNITEIESNVAEALDSIDVEGNLNIIVTGLTSVTVALIKECHKRKIPLVLWHFNSAKPLPTEEVALQAAKLEDHYIRQSI